MVNLRQRVVGFKPAGAWWESRGIKANKLKDVPKTPAGGRPHVKTINLKKVNSFLKTLNPKKAEVFRALAEEITKNSSLPVEDLASNTARKLKEKQVFAGHTAIKQLFLDAVLAGAIKKK